MAGAVPPEDTTGEVPVTDVIVPPVPVAAIEMPPAELVMVTPEPAVKVVRVNPVPLPISKAPFTGVVVRPVPPLAIGKVPVTPVVKGKPVTLVITPLAVVPKAGVTNVGLVANTKAPEPVSLVTAAARFAELGVAKKVATPVPRPDTPVAIGKPVAFVSVALDGVPKAGVTRVGLVAKTAEPEPVSSVKAPASCADVNDPRDVTLPTEVTAPVRLALVVTLPAVRPAAVPVMFVPTRAEGVPRFGVTNVGLVANTKAPVPVSSVTAARKLAELGVPKNVATPAPKDVRPVPPEAAANGVASVKLDR